MKAWDMSPADLKQAIGSATSSLKDMQDRLKTIQRGCRHKWGETKYVPDHQAAYTIEGDPPGTMGVDWRGPTHVPSKTTKRWKRTCELCTLEQTTERTKNETTAGKIPGTGGTVEVPDFGSWQEIY